MKQTREAPFKVQEQYVWDPMGVSTLPTLERENSFLLICIIPVEVNGINLCFNCPLEIAYKDGGVYIAEYGAGRLSCVDIDNNLIYNPSKMNVCQLKTSLEKQKMNQNADK